jgi:uncharacterized protein (DUF433 family)
MQVFNERIEMNSDIMLGKPVIKGTRVTVQNIVEELGAGYSFQDVMNAHPRLQQEDIHAALQYADGGLRN